MLMHFGSAGDFPGAMNLPAGICVCEDSVDLFLGQIHPGFKPKRLIVVTNQFGPDKVSLYALGDLAEGHTAQELAAAAAPVKSGVGTPSAEQLKLQSPAGDEPRPGTGSAGPESAPDPTGQGVPANPQAPSKPEKPR
jgi:hypothetical protein